MSHIFPASSDLVDQLLNVVGGRSELGGCLKEFLRTTCELVHRDVGVLRVREGDLLRTRAVIGLRGDDQVKGVHQSAPNCRVERLAPGDARVSDAMRASTTGEIVYVSCCDNDTEIATLLLGAQQGEELLTADQVATLEWIAPRAARAIHQRLTRESAVQAVRVRDEVLAIVAHDLRNPVSVIAATANNILKKSTDAVSAGPLQRILRAAGRADHLIDDLLQVDAIQTGRLRLQPRGLEIADVILAAVESQQALAVSAGVIIGSDLSPQLPPIDGDPERLLEVLENLIGNAIKFTRPGGSVTVGATCSQHEVRVSVEDTGVGIAAEQLPHLFDRLLQARKRDRRGTGLGLTICRGIVEAHGGRIWAESVLGRGTTLSFAIPASHERRDPQPSTQKANILIVDDRRENLLSLAAILSCPEYDLVTAQSGDDALKLALREQFCVALIDIAMPGMTGLELAAHLKQLERTRDIPIIFITAFGDDPEEIHRAYSAGGVDYLVRPLDADIVRKKVAVFVGLSQRWRPRERLPG